MIGQQTPAQRSTAPGATSASSSPATVEAVDDDVPVTVPHTPARASSAPVPSESDVVQLQGVVINNNNRYPVLRYMSV